MLRFLTEASAPEVPGVVIMLIILLAFLYIATIFAAMGAAAVAYIFQSLGMHKIASRRGINNPWLAWVPFGNLWIMGSISDQYQYVKKGKITNRRKILLGYCIAYFAIVMTYSLLVGIAAGMASVTGTVSPIVGVMTIFFYLLMIAVAIIMFVFEYIALYDLYVSAVPERATKYLLLSIFINITMPIFIFKCRDKDGGMPPRKDAAKPAEISAPETLAEETPVTEEGFATPEEFEEDSAEEPEGEPEEVFEEDFAESEEESETTEPTE